jgi:hypothetical protein
LSQLTFQFHDFSSPDNESLFATDFYSGRFRGQLSLQLSMWLTKTDTDFFVAAMIVDPFPLSDVGTPDLFSERGMHPTVQRARLHLPANRADVINCKIPPVKAPKRRISTAQASGHQLQDFKRSRSFPITERFTI